MHHTQIGWKISERMNVNSITTGIMYYILYSLGKVIFIGALSRYLFL